MSDVASRLHVARAAKGMTAEDVADAAGLPKNRVAAIESGQDLSTYELDAIAHALGRNVDDLLSPPEPIRRVLLRAGNASKEATSRSVDLLADFVRNYEFVRSLVAE